MGRCVLPRATPQVEQPRPPATPANNGSGGSSAVFPVPPGMSDYSFKRVTGENPFKPEELEQVSRSGVPGGNRSVGQEWLEGTGQEWLEGTGVTGESRSGVAGGNRSGVAGGNRSGVAGGNRSGGTGGNRSTKLGLVKFLSSGVVAESDILIHLAVAAADTRFSVANAADMELKKISGSINWSSVSTLAPLYQLFMGTQLLATKSRPSATKPEHRRLPASTRIRLKILPFLSKARGNALIFPACIQVFFDSLYGTNTNLRLKIMALQFSFLIILGSTAARLTPVAGVLLSGLLKLIAEEDATLKALAYSAAGKLGSRVPHLVNKDLVLLQTFFQALSQEEADVRLAVREALLNMVDAFGTPVEAGAKGEEESSHEVLMQALLASQVESEEPMARFVAVRYASTVFPATHVPSRYLLLLACGDSKDEVFTEALKSLYGSSKQKSPEGGSEEGPGSKMELPPFKEMACYLAEKSTARTQNTATRYTVGSHVLPYPPKTYAAVSLLGYSRTYTSQSYVRYTLTSPSVATQSDVRYTLTSPSLATQSDVRYTLTSPSVATQSDVRYTLTSPSLATQSDVRYTLTSPSLATQSNMLNYLRLCLARSAGVPITFENAQFPGPHAPQTSRYLRSLYESEPGQGALQEYLTMVEQLLTANGTAVPLACLVEVLGSIPDLLAPKYLGKLAWFKGFLSSPTEAVRELAALLYAFIIVHGLDTPQFEETLRELITVTVKSRSLETRHGHLLSLSHALERKIMSMKKFGTTDKLATWPLYKDATNAIVSQLSHQNTMMVAAACTGIGELARCAALPLVEGSISPTDGGTELGKLDLVRKLQEHTNKLTTKAKEGAALTLGLLCLGEVFPHRKEVMQGFLDTASETRDVEVQMTVGEALVCCIQGQSSPLARDVWTTSVTDWSPIASPTMDADLAWLLGELLELARRPQPNPRQAACIWMLALLKHCPKGAPLRDRLPDMQRAFMDLLADPAEIVQDVASKGLALVYESSGEESQAELVQDLLEQLTSGRRAAVQVTSDTQLFEEGALGKSPTGGNLSTYKELCSLASDLNQPDLIYKFMHLANHNAIWNSKKGAAFGFSTIASKAGQQLSEHLPKIIPRLYRYRFDPTPRIQNSMASIWHALVPETQKTVEQYKQEILLDLCENLTSSQWRVRTSCCVALQDFLRSISLYDCVDRLSSLWGQLLRVMDDVHEGTRQAATNTAKDLSKLCVRCCDASNGKAGEKIVEAILPVLLGTGICSTVAEIRAISTNPGAVICHSLQTVSQLVGVAGPLLRPHLPILIPALLEAAGELEQRSLSQLSCVLHVDAECASQMMPRLLELLRGSVGLGTRVAASHLVVLLAHHLKEEFQPHTGKLLAALVHGLSDRNPIIRKHYASTIGHLVTVARTSSLEKLFAKLRTWYFDKEDESIRSACAFTLQSIGQHSSDLMKNYTEVVAPLVFFAMHANKAPDSSVGVWEEIWHELTPGTESGIRQNVSGICELLKTALESPSWTMKAQVAVVVVMLLLLGPQAARGVSTVASKMGAALSVGHRDSLIDILMTGLGGRTWTGKENLLKALSTIVTNCKDSLREVSSQVRMEAMLDVILRESRKEQPFYKKHALHALGDVLRDLEVDRFDEVYDAVKDIFKEREPGSENKEDVEEEEVSGTRSERLLLTETVYETLGKAWPSNKDTQARHQEKLLDQCVSQLPKSVRPVQVAMMTALHSYVDKLCLLEGDTNVQDEEILVRLIDKVNEALKYALDVQRLTQLRNLANTFEKSLEDVNKDHAPEVKSRLEEIKEVLKS
uniref:Uncharacterized protein n=2 Tax=Timema TaxID=61471 RepID=A0A7R9NYB5_9NEOP|nr:unnamed protein product [Timema tahoe]